MKPEIKKAVIILAAAAMTLSMYSCGSEAADKKDSSKTEDVTTTAVTTEAFTSEETAAVSDNDSDVEIDTTSGEDEVDVDSLVYEFKGLKTEKYISAFKDGRYKMVGQAGGIGAAQEAYIDVNQNKMLLTIDYLGQKFTMFIDNGKEYTILGDKYFKSDEQSSAMNSIAPYKNCGYVESGEKQIDGATYYFDKFYDTDTKSSMNLIVDKDGNLYGMEEAGVVTSIKELTTDFDDSVFNVLDGCTEATEEEFMNLLTGSAGREESNAE